MQALPRGQLYYPDVASTRVKHNAIVECGPSRGVSYVTQMSPPNMGRCSKLGVGSCAIAIWCYASHGLWWGAGLRKQGVWGEDHSSKGLKGKTDGATLHMGEQSKPLHGGAGPSAESIMLPKVVSVRVEHNANIERGPSGGVNYVTQSRLNECKMQCKH